MALTHAKAHDVVDLRPLGTALTRSVTHSLLKTDQLQLMRLVLAAGQSLPEHRVTREITLQCLEGEVDVSWPDGHCLLRAGQLVMLPGGELHAVAAIQDASVLVTVLLGR